MIKRMDADRFLDMREARRIASDNRTIDRIEKREIAAAKMIGELCREGKTVYYINPEGGRYREGTRVELIAFLLRNKYV